MADILEEINSALQFYESWSCKEFPPDPGSAVGILPRCKAEIKRLRAELAECTRERDEARAKLSTKSILANLVNRWYRD